MIWEILQLITNAQHGVHLYTLIEMSLWGLQQLTTLVASEQA